MGYIITFFILIAIAFAFPHLAIAVILGWFLLGIVASIFD